MFKQAVRGAQRLIAELGLADARGAHRIEQLARRLVGDEAMMWKVEIRILSWLPPSQRTEAAIHQAPSP
jgi:hypothetical protein